MQTDRERMLMFTPHCPSSRAPSPCLQDPCDFQTSTLPWLHSYHDPARRYLASCNRKSNAIDLSWCCTDVRKAGLARHEAVGCSFVESSGWLAACFYPASQRQNTYHTLFLIHATNRTQYLLQIFTLYLNTLQLRLSNNG